MTNRLSPYLKRYKDWGFSVIPIQPNSKRPSIESWKEYQERRADNAELGNWFSTNNTNIAIVCGHVSKNLCVLDFDSEELYEAYNLYWTNKHNGQQLTDITPVVKTGRGGYHIYLRSRRLPRLYHPTGDERKRLPDIQSTGGYVVAPPSIHPNGQQYELLNPDIDTLLEIGNLDEIELNIPAPHQTEPGERPPQWVTTALKGVKESERDNTCIRLAGYFRYKHPQDITCAILEGFAEKCIPPIDEYTLLKCVKSAYTYTEMNPEELTKLTNSPITDKTDMSDNRGGITDKTDKTDKTDMSDNSSRGRNIWKLVDAWMAQHEGEKFDLDTICRHLDIKDREGRHHVTKKLSYEVAGNGVEKSDKLYRLINHKYVNIDWVNASPSPPLVITWPYGIDDLTTFGFDGHVVISPGDIVVVTGVSNMGKALRNGTPVLTTNAWRDIDTLRVGDVVCTPDGGSSPIAGVYPQGPKHCYRFTFNDGSTIDSSTDHLWKVQMPYNRRSRKTGRGMPNTQFGEWSIVTTLDIVRRCGEGKVSEPKRIRIPSVDAMEFPYKWVFMDPYLMGLLLGDGCLAETSTSITTADQSIVEHCKSERTTAKKRGKSPYTYGLRGLLPEIRRLGLGSKKSKDKYIPRDYLWNDSETRMGVLQGLMDTDGSIDKNGYIEFDSVSEELTLGVQFLVRSLGGRAVISKRKSGYRKDGVLFECQDSYRVHIKMNRCPFRLERKVARFKPYIKTCDKILYDIENIGEHDCTCIRIADEKGLFVVKDFIVTHNSAFCLNLLWNNMDKYPCTLMGNEYEAGKFKRRVSRMTWKDPIDDTGKPKFELIERYENWQDIIRPDNINIIDWINLADAFYQIGQIIQGIKSRLREGIAVIVLQKAEGKELGLGGGFSQHLASLYLAIDFGRLTVVKAKEWYKLNVNNRMYGFDIRDAGSKFANIREVMRCKACNNSGRTAKGECQMCFGHGFIEKDKGKSWSDRY